MPKKIYNKNAREKALLEEAYTSVYNEGQFWGRDDLVKKGKEEDIARGAVKLVGKTKDGNHTSATLPKGDPKIKELEAQGYKRVSIEDNEDKDFRDEQRDQDPHRHEGLSDFEAEQRDQDPHRHEDEEGELSDDWEKPNYRGDQHFFQPGEIVEVGPWGENDEYHHLEVVLQIKGDVINTIPITDDAYGMQYGGRGGADISLIRPQSEIDYDHGDFKPADGREW